MIHLHALSHAGSRLCLGKCIHNSSVCCNDVSDSHWSCSSGNVAGAHAVICSAGLGREGWVGRACRWTCRAFSLSCWPSKGQSSASLLKHCNHTRMLSNSSRRGGACRVVGWHNPRYGKHKRGCLETAPFWSWGTSFSMRRVSRD